MEEKPKTWGGKRREGTTKTPVTFGLDNDLLERLERANIRNRSKFYNTAIRQRLDRLDDMEQEAMNVE